jgi:hypothetical protein
MIRTMDSNLRALHSATELHLLLPHKTNNVRNYDEYELYHFPHKSSEAQKCIAVQVSLTLAIEPIDESV